LSHLHKFLCCLVCIVALAATRQIPDAQADEFVEPAHARLVLEGAVSDSATGEPIPHATVQVVGTGMACKTNADGRFRLTLDPGAYQIKISHIGYYSKKVAVGGQEPSAVRDIRLLSSVIDMGERKVYTRAYDPAQRIIIEAIARKDDILSRIHDYVFDAYSRIVIANAAKPDSENVMLIAESRSTSYWEYPDRYKQVITARTQSANIPASSNLVAAGEMLNFNRNRIEIGEHEIVSPTARDALDHYEYYLLDTVYIDTHPIFVLEIEPKNMYAPLFIGEIHIADSTYDVVKVDVGFSPGVHLPMIDSARYYQSMAQFDDRYWLPIEIGFSGRVTLDVPFPGIPRRIDFRHVASISNYRVDSGIPEDSFDEYDLVVSDSADDIDSAAWADLRLVPLTGLEEHGYERIDSIKHAPKPFYKYALRGLAAAVLLVTMGDHDLVHYNRVEGPYVGLGTTQRDLVRNTRLRLKAGYAFDAGLWQYEYGASYRFLKKRKLWLGAAVRDEIAHRPTIISSESCNATANALLFKFDPFDYYRERGYRLFSSVEPFDRTLMTVEFIDFRQASVVKHTDYGFLRRSITPRDNPPILDGTMRSVSVALRYDSRPRIDNKGEDIILDPNRYFIFESGIEYSSSDVLDGDFDFRRFFIRLRARIAPLGLGATQLSGYAGSSGGDLPPQRFFIVDFHDPNFFKAAGFNTVHETGFAGDRAATVYAVHDFGPYMFRNTGIGLLKKIPFGLTAHGGAMWTEFKREPTCYDVSICIAPTAYTEIGFGFDNLTPFLMPFNLALNFTWRLSNHNTRSFTILMDFKL